MTMTRVWRVESYDDDGDVNVYGSFFSEADAVEFCAKINAVLEDSEPQVQVNWGSVSDAPIGVTRVWLADLDGESFIEARTEMGFETVGSEAVLGAARALLMPGAAEAAVKEGRLVGSHVNLGDTPWAPVSVEVGLFKRRSGTQATSVQSVSVSGTDKGLVVAECARVMRGWAQDLLSEG